MSLHQRVTQLHHAVLADLGIPEQTEFPSFWDETGFVKQPADFAKEYLAYNLVRKIEPFERKEDVPTDVLQRSLAAFAEAEHRCMVVNQLGHFYTPIGTSAWDGALIQEAIRLARAYCSRVLMDVWPRWEELHFTGGASRFSNRSRSLPHLKWSGFSGVGKVLSATTPALDFCLNVVKEAYGPSWAIGDIATVSNSRFDFVAKTAKTVRFMAMEPEINMLLQKGLGDAIRAGLLNAGMNLNDQSINQELSRIGSVFRTRATIDLSSASDCVSLLLARLLLPARYWEMVKCFRTPYTSVGGYARKLEKVATMGNGFIFELQSLLYASLGYACTTIFGGRECDLSVYGDDIIVSDNCATPLMELLEYFGFMPNFEKSFHGNVPFRESCGKHWYVGHDVTPFYVKSSLDRLSQVFRAYNGLKYWSERTGVQLDRAFKLLASWLRREDRVVVPSNYSIDSGLHFPMPNCRFPKRVVTKHGDIRHRFKCLVAQSTTITERLDDEVLYNWWLRHQTAPLVPPEAWAKLHSPMLPGVPRERLSVRRVDPEMDLVWAYRDVGQGEIP